MKNKRYPRIPKKFDTTLDDEDIDYDAIDAAEQARLNITAEKKRMKQWITGNNDFDAKPLLAKWRKTVKKHRQDLLNLAIDVYSLADGAIATNEVLRFGMGMEQASLDMESVVNILGKVFVIRATELFSLKAGISAELRRELLNRAIAREFPLKDNKVTEPRVVNVPPMTSRAPIVRSGPTFTGVAPSKYGAKRPVQKNVNDEKDNE